MIKTGNATIVNLRNIVESPLLKFCMLRPSFGLGSHSSPRSTVTSRKLRQTGHETRIIFEFFVAPIPLPFRSGADFGSWQDGRTLWLLAAVPDVVALLAGVPAIVLV